MRILITLFSTSWGGAEESIINLAEGLGKEGHKIFVLWLRNYNSLLPGKNNYFKTFNLKVTPFFYRLISPFLVLFLCLKYKIELANLNWRYVEEESRYLKFCGTKCVATIRAVLIDRDDVSEFRNLDAIIGVSEAVIERIKQLGFSKPCFVVYNGIDIAKLKTFDLKKIDFNYALSMSRLVKWKRVDWSIKAVSNLRKEGYNFKLDIYGEGPERDVLLSLIKELKEDENIKIVGYVDKNSDALEKYGIYLLPSYEEPFGKTLVENVVREKVIVASKSGGIPELLNQYPLLFNRDDFGDYVEKIKTAFLNGKYYQKKITSLRKRFTEYFNTRRVVQDYISVYNQIIQ